MELVRGARLAPKEDFVKAKPSPKASRKAPGNDFNQTLEARKKEDRPRLKELGKTEKAEQNSKALKTPADNSAKIKEVTAAIKEQGEKEGLDSEVIVIESEENVSEELKQAVDVLLGLEFEAVANKEEALNKEDGIDYSLLSQISALLETIVNFIEKKDAAQEQEVGVVQISLEGSDLKETLNNLLIEVETLLANNDEQLKFNKTLSDLEKNAETPKEPVISGDLLSKLDKVIESMETNRQTSNESQQDKTNGKSDEFLSLLKDLKGEITKNSKEKEAPVISTLDIKKPLATAKNTDEANLFVRLEQSESEVDNKVQFSNQRIGEMRTMTRQAIFAQVNDAIEKAPLLSERSEMILKLKPEQLGKVDLKIEVHNENIIARFDVASQMVKEAIEANLEDLKNSLRDKGFGDMSFDVNVNKDNQESDGQNQSAYRRRIDFDANVEEGKESYIRSLSALVAETTFEHLA